MAPTPETVADAMYDLVRDCAGKRNLKPTDLTKAALQRFGDDCDKQVCKEAIRLLMDSGKTTYAYAGGSFVVLNPEYQGR